MSATAQRPGVADPFAMRFDENPAAHEAHQLAPMPNRGANAVDDAMAQAITAQRCPIKRNKAQVLAEAQGLAAAAGQEYFYRFPVKKKDGTTEYIEGPSIGCAMGAVSCYGNCRVEAFPAMDTNTHWVFMARFVDYEKGVTVIRSFQQRKGQGTMGRDQGRQEDIAFQIGQSKALRNVVVAALPWLTEEMFRAAKSGMLSKIERNPDAYRQRLRERFAELEIPLPRVERVVGRPADRWLAPDMAKLIVQIQAIIDGYADADEAFPPTAAAAEDLRDAGDSKLKADDDRPANNVAEPTDQQKAAADARARALEAEDMARIKAAKAAAKATRAVAPAHAAAKAPGPAPAPAGDESGDLNDDVQAAEARNADIDDSGLEFS